MPGLYGSTSLPDPTHFANGSPVPSGSSSQISDFSSIDWGNIGTDLKNWLKDNWQGLVKAGLATATTVEAIKNSQAANNYTSKALDMAQSDYDSRAPFRTAAVGKLASTRPDLSGLFQNPGNPYKAINRSIPAVGSSPLPTGETPSTNGPPPSTIGTAPQLPTPPGTPQTPAPPIPINPPPASGRIPRIGSGIPVSALSNTGY